MRRFIFLGCVGLALAIGVRSAQAEPPPDAKRAKESRLRKFWQDCSDALRRLQDGVRRDNVVKSTPSEGGPCRH
jgi:hypothetical protein